MASRAIYNTAIKKTEHDIVFIQGPPGTGKTTFAACGEARRGGLEPEEGSSLSYLQKAVHWSRQMGEESQGYHVVRDLQVLFSSAGQSTCSYHRGSPT